MAKWRIYQADGAWDVTRNTKAFRYGFDTPEDALSAIKRSRKWTKGDTVYLGDRKLR